MSVAKTTWLALRLLRWLLIVALVVYTLYVHLNRSSLVSIFGHLPLLLESLLFIFFGAPFVVGLLELMMREKAGVPRPPYFSFKAPNVSP